MFSCAACLRRALRCLDTSSSGSVLTSQSPFRSAVFETSGGRQSTSLSVRQHSTVQSINRGHHRREIRQSLHSPNLKPNQRSNRAIDTKVNRRNRAAVANNAGHLDVVDGTTRKELARQKAAIFQAQYLNDPLRLASAVLDRLRDSNLEDALELVRASEKVGDGKITNNVVSWNHCIDWTMNQGETAQALKIYNEMKKRGHKPDAHTYTILLRGLGRHAKTPQAVANAIKIYDSIYAPNSAVKPNSIHTNAVMNVCARAGDMDALWTVAGRLPESGAAAPDKWTYTTILNALRDDARKRAVQLAAKEGDDADTQQIFGEAVTDGRKLWTDVSQKWQKADLLIDESLTCAMGRLLMTSSQRSDLDDVFNLVQQTMNIPRATPNYEAQDGEEFQVREGSQDNEEVSMETMKTTEHVKTTQSERSRDSSSPSNVSGPGRGLSQLRRSALAQPSNNTLSMLIETSTLLKQPHMGKYYWDYLTSESKVQPDTQNITAFLRMLRISRSSKAALELLSQTWPAEIAETLYKPGNFVIAMSTCVRDKNNPNVFETASKLLDLMEEKQRTRSRDPHEEAYGIAAAGQTLGLDPRVLAMYLNLAVATTKGINPKLRLQRTRNGDLDFDRDPKSNHTMRALARLGPSSVNVVRLMKLKMDNLEDEDTHRARVTKHRMGKFVDINRVADDMDDIITLVSNMISAYDKLIVVSSKLEDFGLGPLDQNYINDCRIQSRKLTAYRTKLVPALTTRDGEAPRKHLWAGYDATKDESGMQVDAQESEGDQDSGSEVEEKTPDRTKFLKEVKTERRQQAWAEASRPLSRRQKQEVESLRKAERVRRQFPPSMLKPRSTMAVSV